MYKNDHVSDKYMYMCVDFCGHDLASMLLLPPSPLPSPKSAEYKSAMEIISPIVEDHHKTMKKGEPQLNYCDKAVMVKCIWANSRVCCRASAI